MVSAFIDGVLSRGVEVIDIGLSSTDQLWFASGWLDLTGCHVHRKPQSRGIQRDQVLPGGREADHLSQPRRDRSTREHSGTDRRPRHPESASSGTCYPRTPTICTPLST